LRAVDRGPALRVGQGARGVLELAVEAAGATIKVDRVEHGAGRRSRSHEVLDIVLEGPGTVELTGIQRLRLIIGNRRGHGRA